MVAVPKQPAPQQKPQPRPGYVTPEEYLERERNAETRSEYHDGVIVAMAGASKEHNRISDAINGELYAQIKGGPCEKFSESQRVFIAECNKYFYPDIAVVCGVAQFQTIQGLESLTNPTLLMEILSESTEQTDRVDKRDCYGTLNSLSTYVLVAQDQPRIEVYRRQANRAWLLEVISGLDSVVTLDAIGCELRLADVYARVPFPPAPNTASESVSDSA